MRPRKCDIELFSYLEEMTKDALSHLLICPQLDGLRREMHNSKLVNTTTVAVYDIVLAVAWGGVVTSQQTYSLHRIVDPA